MYIVAVILVSLTLLYWLQISRIAVPRRPVERFVDYITALEGPDSFLPQAGAFPEGEQVLLKDFMKVKAKTGVSDFSAKGCADANKGAQEELGGQYVQRTNNYRRTNPDNCSAPLSDFVGSIYDSGAVGDTVPCDGSC